MFEYEDIDDDATTDDPEVEEEESASETQEPAATGAQASTEPADAASRLTRILDWAGAEDDADTTLLESITEDGVAKLPPEAKVVLKQIRAATRKEREAAEAAMAERERKAAVREAELDRKAHEVLESRSALGKLFDTEGIRKLVAQAEQKKPEEIDVTTPEGMREYLDIQAANQLAQFTAPIRRDAENARRQAAKTAIERQYADEFAQAGFRDEVNAAITADMEAAATAARAAGQDPDKAATEAVAGKLENYIVAVAYRRKVAKEKAVREARRRAAQESANHVHRSNGSGAESEPMEPPPEVEREGGAAVMRWYKSHPRAYETFKRENRIGA